VKHRITTKGIVSYGFEPGKENNEVPTPQLGPEDNTRLRFATPRPYRIASAIAAAPSAVAGSHKGYKNGAKHYRENPPTCNQRCDIPTR
jgi:hypothetical protein